nr:uncharacterized protein LOC129387524 isoform X2 [Dermacentor andersoni]
MLITICVVSAAAAFVCFVDGAVPDPFRRKEIEITYRLPCTANICADMCNVRGCFQGVCKYPPDQVGVPRICICRGHVATCA